MRRVAFGILLALQLALVLGLLGVFGTVRGWLPRLLVLAGAPAAIALWPFVWTAATLAAAAVPVAAAMPGRWLDGLVGWQLVFLEALALLAPANLIVTDWLGPAAAPWAWRAVLIGHIIAAAGLAAWLRRLIPAGVLGRVHIGIGLTVLVIAIIYSGLSQGPFFWIWLFGMITALVAAVAWVVPRNRLGKILAHATLVLGCVVFAFPFLWLVSTSFKYNEEIFVYPPKWVPSAPPAVRRSPYLTAEPYRALQRPEGIDKSRWQRLRPRLEQAVWAKAQQTKLLTRTLTGPIDAEDVPRTLSHGLLASAAKGVEDRVWAWDRDEPIVEAVTERVDAARVAEVWKHVHRSVALRDPRVRDVDLVEVALGPAQPAGTSATSLPAAGTRAGGHLHLWRPGPNAGTTQCSRRAAEIKPPKKDEKPGKPAADKKDSKDPLLILYDFSRGNRAVAYADLPLPFASDRLLSISVPMRQDRSWHKLRFEVEIDGRLYATEDQLYLGNYRWQDITLKFKDKDRRDERDEGIWPIVKTADSGGYAERGKFRLRLIIDRCSRWRALWNKYTDSYRRAYIATEHRWRYLFNSIYLVVLNVLGQILSCSLVAYAFARLKWPGRDVLFAVMLSTMMLPPQVTMIPVFLIFKHLHWYNTLKALWVPSFLGGAFFIFMLRQFMKTIPVELEDAAKIDGCGFFGVYWRIILPLMKPALAAVAIFTFMGTWNNFMGPLIYLNDQRLYPLALGLFEFKSQYGGEFGMMMAASTMMTLPVVAIFFLAQKYFIQGVTLTGMKG